MCTVVIDVPLSRGEPVRLLAVRDEDRNRPWRGLGMWWPDRPGVLGVRDDRAGGAWLAVDVDRHRLAVLLNRDDLSARRDDEVVSRGTIALDAVGDGIASRPPTRGFNLVEVDADGAHLVEWDGLVARRTRLAPGTHMIAHHAVDDPRTPRVARWLDDFRLAGVGAGPAWWGPWLAVVQASAAASAIAPDEAAGDAVAPDAAAGGPDDAGTATPTDADAAVPAATAAADPADADAAVLRRDEHDGHVRESLVVCVASIGPDGVEVREAALTEPGRWDADLPARLLAGDPMARR